MSTTVSGRRFYGDWESEADVCRDFEIHVADVPGVILYAAYAVESYEGNARVVGRRPDGTLWIIEGSHCSCRGLEGQWEPDETTPGALAMFDPGYAISSIADAVVGWKLLVAALMQNTTWDATIEMYRQILSDSRP